MLAIKTLVEQSGLYRRNAVLLGINYEISVVADNPATANARITDAINEINRVERLLSTFTDDSCINNIHRNAGVQPVKVKPEVFGLINRAVQISALTHGAFDITYTTNDKAVGGYNNIVLDAKAQTVMLSNEGMRISFAASIHGYAADRARRILQMNGIASGIINNGNILLTWGFRPDGEQWTIGTADAASAGKSYANIEISNMAVATTHNKEVHAANTTHTHCIDPQTGFKVSNISSVSVLSPSAEFADALTTPLMSMGTNSGIYLINQLNQVACIMIDDNERVYTSKHINAR